CLEACNALYRQSAMESLMTAKPQPAATIQQVDPVWGAIRANARAIVAEEPALGSMVMANVLNHPSFESALAHRLAERLGDIDVSSDLIRQAFADALLYRP